MTDRFWTASPPFAVPYACASVSGEHEDPNGMAIEPFTLHDNLMLVGGVIASGGYLIAERAPREALIPPASNRETGEHL
jgi:hypothetical protein